MESPLSIKIFRLMISLLIIWLAYHYSMPTNYDKLQSSGRISKISSNPAVSFKKNFNS